VLPLASIDKHVPVSPSHSNGGWMSKNGTAGGNNYPLTGGKYNNFEGGIRMNSFASGVSTVMMPMPPVPALTGLGWAPDTIIVSARRASSPLRSVAPSTRALSQLGTGTAHSAPWLVSLLRTTGPHSPTCRPLTRWTSRRFCWARSVATNSARGWSSPLVQVLAK
jgi:hypothetical protein